MFTNSFNLTAVLKAKLANIDLLYKEIMIIPISPNTEVEMRTSAIVSHIQGWVNLTNQPYSKESLHEILEQFQAKNESTQVAKIINYKKTLNYIRENWAANPANVNFEAIKELSETLGVNFGTRQTIEPLLTYIQTQPIHPAVQAAIAHLAFYPSRSSYLLSQLFLAKAGYDLRGWLSLEDCWSQNKQSYLQVIQQATDTKNSTGWLEYFSQALIVQMSLVKSHLEKISKVSTNDSHKRLNKRQIAILELIEKSPDPVTNRQVQDAFNVSQITASRDLGKLSLSGFIASQGGGRSTAYTRS